jgi:hypothetical protein
LRFLSLALRRSSTPAVLVVGATALACGLVGPAAAQQIISGPLKVTDSGPGVSPSGYAIKGVTSFSNDSAVFGYGTGASALNIDGVTGYPRRAAFRHELRVVSVVSAGSPVAGSYATAERSIPSRIIRSASLPETGWSL